MKYVFVSGLMAVVAPTAVGATDWQFIEIEGAGVGTLNACAISAIYDDGFVSIRLYDDVMDMVFQRRDFSMPYGTELGVMGVHIDRDTHMGFAATFARDQDDTEPTTSAMQIILNPDDYPALFDGFRNGNGSDPRVS